MKRFLCVLLALVMVLSLVGCGKAASSDKEKETETILETESTPVTETVTEPVTEVILKPDPNLQPLSVLLCHEFYSATNWRDVVLADDCAKQYPQLAATLTNLNAQTLALVQKNDETETVMDDSNTYVQRADSRLLSFFRENDCQHDVICPDAGGIICLNLDPATGKPVTIDQVLTDMDALPQLLEDALRETYDNLPKETFDGTAKLLESYAPEAYAWTMNYLGMTFYFGAEELADGSAGALTVTLWFRDHPEVFVDAYTQWPENGYALLLPLDADVEVNLVPDDGKTNRLHLTHLEDDSLKIELDQSHYLKREDVCYDASYTPYLVTSDNQNYYLYIAGYCATSEYGTHGYYFIDIYSLKSGQIVPLTSSLEHFSGVWMDDDNYDRFFNDPTNFYTGQYFFNGLPAERSYHIDSQTGIPQPNTDHYTFQWFPNFVPLTSMVPLEVEILSDNTTETIPAGTKFEFLRTDGETYVDARLEDGRECRLSVMKQLEEDMETWYSNGHRDYDCFDTHFYAG